MTDHVNMTKQPINVALQLEFIKAFPPFLIYLATIIILLSFFKDLVRVGFNPSWLLIRACYFPLMIIVWKISTKKLSATRFYEAPLWAAGLYITFFCTYFSFATGGLRSDYIYGLIQFYFAIAVMPLTAVTFYTLSLVSVAIYVESNILKFGHASLHDHATISTLIPLLVFSPIVYLIMSKIRRAKINLQNELSKTLMEREEIIREQSKKLAEVETKAALGLMAVQVAHDIRSPLSALQMIIQDISQIPEEKRIITRNAIGRIRDIANNLLYQHQNNQITISTCLLTSVIDSLISEKRMQFRSKLNANIEFIPSVESYGLFAYINSHEFKRVLSNLINNAVEAINYQGDVLVSLEHDINNALIKVKDNGPGIPKVVLERLGEPGNTHQKEGGSGLGLSSAIQNFKKWNASMEFVATEIGTLILIKLPLAKAPPWFLTNLSIAPNSKILILDDDTTIHQIWNDRFSQLNLARKNITWHNFSNKATLVEWLRKNNLSQNHFTILCDYEIIGSDENGLDILESLWLQSNSILVTSRYEQPEIQDRCEKMGICLLPKSLATLIPIKISDIENRPEEKVNFVFLDDAPSQPDIVLIEDDQTLIAAWQITAKMQGHRLMTFSNTADARKNIPLLSLETPIYIDSHLSSEEKGESFAKELYDIGFRNLYLATGYAPDHFGSLPWIKAIVTKNYPYQFINCGTSE